MSKTTKTQVTFGKMYKSPIYGDPSVMDVFIGSEQVGYIEGDVHDVGATSRVYRVYGYTVTLWAAEGKSFSVDEHGNNPRAALAAAKAYVKANARTKAGQ